MATSKYLKPRRGSTAEHSTFKGEAYEITFDTDKKTGVAHDGLTMGGFPLAHEATVTQVDSELRNLIDQKVSDLEGVSSSELAALETSLRGLINLNAQQQTARDNAQDDVLTSLNSSLRALIAEQAEAINAAQSSADAVASETDLGRVKLSDSTSSTSAASSGIAASPKAVKAAYDKAVAAIPVGSVVAFAGNPSSAPSGFLLCNGAAVSRSTYAALFSAIGTTYGAGNGSSTFNLPDLTNRFIQGSGTAGTTKEAGLPNITGSLSYVLMGNNNSPSGAFSSEYHGALYRYVEDTSDNVGGWKKLSFDASKASTNASNIYGKNATVQPPALTMRYYIKY